MEVIHLNSLDELADFIKRISMDKEFVIHVEEESSKATNIKEEGHDL